MASKHYLYLETEGIQRFVFSPTKLKIIRGGSALLDHFNRVEMPSAIHARGGEVIFTGGGHCLARGLAIEEATQVAENLARSLKKRTVGQVSLAWGTAEEAEGAAWKDVWAHVGRDRHERGLKQPHSDPSLPPFVALCSSCGVSPARALHDLGDRERKALCGACQQRIKEGNAVTDAEPNTIWARLRPHLGEHEHAGNDAKFKRLLPEREFEQLAELGGSGRKYLAYLYCDGNGLGRKLREARTAKAYGELSRLVDDALHKSVAKAMGTLCAPDRPGGKFGAEVLMLGGDDLIVALPADRGAAFTTHVLEEFHRETSGEFRLSAGLVLAPYSTPITILQSFADSLLRSAKRLAYLEEAANVRGDRSRPKSTKRLPAVGYVDFQELTSAEVDVERSHAVTCRPYRLDDFKKLVVRVRELTRTRVPRGRLHTLVDALHGSEREAQTVTQLVVGRARLTGDRDQQGALRALLEPFGSVDRGRPLRPYATAADDRPDLAFDLYDGAHRWSAVPDAVELINHVAPESEGERA